MLRMLLVAAPLLVATGACGAVGWPPTYPTAGGTQVGLTANLAYDVNRFTDADPEFEDAAGWRRTDVGVFARRKDVFDASIQYDFESRSWLDTFVRVQSKAILGRDVGAVRVGWFKTPVGLDAVAATRAQTFLEPSLPTQAIYQGRRMGLEWGLARPRYATSLAYFGGNDPEGREQGHTWAGRAAWTPRKREGDVLHLGVAGSREHPASGSARLRARPEAGLTDIRIVDSGGLARTHHVDRAALELIRVRGPWTLQAEVMRADVARSDGRPKVDARGGYAWVGWTVTGESRPYSGVLGNVSPTGRAAVELLARYSTLDLGDLPVAGGMATSWTIGTNVYVGPHWKFQVNYVDVHGSRARQPIDADNVQARVQFHF